MQESVTQDRERYIGGSDISSIMEFPEAFTKRFDLLMYKAMLKENTFNGNEYTQYGNELEPKIRDYINTKYGYHFVEDKIILDDSKVLPIRYHDDGTDSENKLELEIKTTSNIHEKAEEYPYYLVQLLTGMKARGYANGILAVYSRPEDMNTEFDPKRLQIFSIGLEDYEPLLKRIDVAVKAFREDYDWIIGQKFIGNEIKESDLPSRNAIETICEQTITIGDMKLPVTWLLQNGKKVADAFSEIKSQIGKAMETHGVKSVKFEDLGINITYVPQGEDSIVQKFDENSFKADHARMYNKYLIDTVKKGKAAYVTCRAAKKK